MEMAVNAFFLTAMFLMALALVLMGELEFLAPYRALLIHQYGAVIALFSAALFVNVFSASYLVCRKVFLKDTGRKLAHLEKQLRTGSPISAELAQRLED
jgi:hypothetical protein